MSEEALEKKLGVWGIDKIVREGGRFSVEDYYCIKCYKENKKIPAEIFGPSYISNSQELKNFFPLAPYCKSCDEELNKKFV
ncbi:MAG: hypothetical protein NUV46_02725 [Nanoarchaeota archaeon]|nr:hypothetical protein [Nanoarchaeota archaeon]